MHFSYYGELGFVYNESKEQLLSIVIAYTKIPPKFLFSWDSLWIFDQDS